jgi:phosphoenolpyruvate---glycerone phosphotransferase subunit DhaL
LDFRGNTQEPLEFFFTSHVSRHLEVCMDTLTAAQLRAMMIHVARAVVEAKEALCEADRHVGDGDHGVGMALGFKAAREALEARAFDDAYEVFSTVGRTLIKTMGGASGILFGLLFLAGSKGRAARPSLTPLEFAELFEKALQEIEAKGGARPGDKTLVDGLDPVARGLRSGAEEGLGFGEILGRARKAAEEGKEASRTMVARFGKARSLGERALGYPDPGALSLAVIVDAMAGWANQNL